MKKIALVGCGRIMQRHIEAIRSVEGLEIAVVCDSDHMKADAAARDLGVEAVYDYREIRDVDIVAVLTPSGAHPRHVAEIAELTDIPLILCEKPISLTQREAIEMLARVDACGKRLLPVYQNRYNPLVLAVKDLVEKGQLGNIHQFICNVLWNRNNEYFEVGWHGTQALDGGVLFTQASHYVDMVHFLFGDVDEHKGIGGNLRGLEVFDSVSAVMGFACGTVGSINATVSVFEKNFRTEFTLISEKGTIRLAGTNLNEIEFWNVEGVERPDKEFPLDHIYGRGHNALYQYIADENWEMFPSRKDVLSGIRLMEMLSY